MQANPLIAKGSRFELSQWLALRLGRDRVTLRILIPLVLTTSVLLAAFAISIWRIELKEQTKDAALTAQEVERWLHSEVNQKTAVLKTTSEAIMNDGELMEAFRRRDRAAVLDRAQPLFDSLRSAHGISHFYFHLPDRTVWLRVHAPGVHGDKIERATLLAAERTGQVSSGIERGLTGIFTLRVVSPWRRDGQLLGYLELGVEFESLVQNIRNQLNQDVDFVVAVDKKFIDRQQWTDEMKRTGRTDDWDRFPQMVVINQTVTALPPLAEDYLLAKNPKPKGSGLAGDLQLVFLPVTEAAGAPLGRMIVLQNVAEQMAETRRSIWLVVGFNLVVGAVVIGFFYFFLRGVEKDLSDRTSELQWKTAFLEAQVNSSIDGILVVDQQGKKILQNQRMTALLNIPQDVAEDTNDERQVRWVTGMIRNPGEFIKKVVYLYAHPDEISRDEIELKNGTILDRYSSPVMGKDGRYYGRIWTFRDVTDRKRTGEIVKRLAAIVEHSNEAIIGETLDGFITSWNPAAERMFGYPAAEIIGQPLQLLVPPDHPHEDSEILARFAGGERVRHFETVRIRKDGQRFDVSTTLSPIKDSEGNIVGISKIVRDITERKRAEMALEESQLRYRSLFGNMLEGYAYCRMLFDQNRLRDFIYLEVNSAFERLTGLKDVVGKNVSAVMPGIQEANPELFEVYSRVALTGKPERFETHLKTLGIWLSVAVYSHEKEHFAMVFDNITERKLAEHALRESNEKFQQLVDNITDVFWIRSPDMREVRYLSPAFERIWGRSVASLCAHPQAWVDFVLPEDRERVRGAFATLTGDAPTLEIEYRIVRPDGGIRWVRVRGFQVRDQAGTLLSLTGTITDITERKQSENLVRQSEERYRSLIDSAHDAIFTVGADGTFTSLNPAVETILKITRAEWIGKPFAPLVHPDDLPLAREMFRCVLTGGQVPVHELRGNPGLSRSVLMEMTATAQRDGRGEIIGSVVIGRDITERKQLEVQLFQSQKMETVGKLAGGIAHEFNSILTAIIGQSELLLGDLPGGSPLVNNATEIRTAANRAAVLTRQLLAYGRKQILRPEILDLNAILAGMESTLRHVLGRDTNLHIAYAGPKAVLADAGQIEQVIMNLVINAREAMPNGGQLTVETANVSFDQEALGRNPELKPGDYIMLAITDSGTGMTGEVKARAFEPFFSTKGVGEGAGLGLSTCYGIIKQSGGHMSVYSELGRGTTFKIYLPRAEPLARIPVPRPDSPDLPRGTETILLVEDDPALREMAAALLRRLGYTVLAAANGIEALSLKQERSSGHVDLLFTDVVMPHMSGKELADRVRVLYPHTRILFTSAYTENAIVHQGVLDPGVALLQKPFTPSALARKLRAVLDGAPAERVQGRKL